MKDKFDFHLKNGDSVMFDAASNQLNFSSKSGELRAVTLSYAESRLLQLLLASPGETRSRNEIMEYAWDNRVVAAGSLNQAIFTLRNLINDGADHDLLQTVPRRGYRFNAQYVAIEPGNEQGGTGDGSPVGQVDEAVEDNRSVEIVPPAAASRRWAGLFDSAAFLIPAYSLMVCLLVLVGLHRSGILDTASSNQVIEDLVVGPLTYHFIGESEAENARNKEVFKLALNTPEDDLGGHIWVNKSNRLFDLSCVRADGSTENLIFLEDNKMANLQLEMVRKCMRGYP